MEKVWTSPVNFFDGRVESFFVYLLYSLFEAKSNRIFSSFHATYLYMHSTYLFG